MAEVWIVSIVQRTLEAHREPVSGSYTNSRTYLASETVSPAGLPSARLELAELFPEVAGE